MQQEHDHVALLRRVHGDGWPFNPSRFCSLRFVLVSLFMVVQWLECFKRWCAGRSAGWAETHDYAHPEQGRLVGGDQLVKPNWLCDWVGKTDRFDLSLGDSGWFEGDGTSYLSSSSIKAMDARLKTPNEQPIACLLSLCLELFVGRNKVVTSLLLCEFEESKEGALWCRCSILAVRIAAVLFSTLKHKDSSSQRWRTDESLDSKGRWIWQVQGSKWTDGKFLSRRESDA